MWQIKNGFRPEQPVLHLLLLQRLMLLLPMHLQVERLKNRQSNPGIE